MVSQDTQAIVDALVSLESEVKALKALLVVLTTKLTVAEGSRIVTQEELGKALGLSDRGVRRLLNEKLKSKSLSKRSR
jgi:heterodisulfide reductase subunit A-like polyferredoxin